MPLLKSLAAVGIAKQTVLGTPVTPPAFGFGLRGGTLFNVEVTQEPDAVTGFGSRVRPGADRNDTQVGITFTARAYPRSLPLLIGAAMGSIVTTGTTPKIHTITPDTAGALLPLTIYTRHGSDYNSITDCYIDELTISWARGAIEVGVTAYGVTPNFAVTPWTATNDESAAARFSTFGGTYSLDPITTSPATAKISAGTLTISNNLAPQKLSTPINPTAWVAGPQDLSMSLTTQPDDFAYFRKLVTGSAAGTTVSGTPAVGSFTVLMTIDANNSLSMASTNWQATTTYPEADPEGGIAELVLDGAGYGTSTGLTVIVNNQYSTAY